MADEITVKPFMKLLKGNLTQTINPGTLTFTQAGVGFYHPVKNVGTSEESIATGSFGDVTTEGWCYMRNIDATNYCQWGFSTGVYGGRMEAGETAGPFRMEPGLTLFLKSNTAACNIEIFVAED